MCKIEWLQTCLCVAVCVQVSPFVLITFFLAVIAREIRAPLGARHLFFPVPSCPLPQSSSTGGPVRQPGPGWSV